MSVLDSAKTFLTKHNISAASGIVLAVSTGIDSMVLLHILQQLNHRIIVAHVNHGKREESAEEETFLHSYCEENNLEIEILKLTPDSEKPDGANFQAWAREKRYAFFEEVAQKHNCKFIATAHHADDKAETFFMHALRGSGLNGLTSLQAKNGNVIRPLMDVSRQEIEAFAEAENLAWREDASNETDDYFRNRVRHHILPSLAQAEENWQHGLAVTQQNLADEKALLTAFVEGWKMRDVHVEGDALHISIAALSEIPAPVSLLRHLLFEVDDHLPFEQMASCAHDATGSFYLGKTHRALKNRDWLIVEPIQNAHVEHAFISANAREITQPMFMNFYELHKVESFAIEELKLTKADALVDFEKLTFPLELRLWQAGDSFMPLGMKGFKKVSDYLIDEKVARNEKEKTFVLTSNGEIVWLVGHRIDERFKVGEETQKMYLGRLSE